MGEPFTQFSHGILIRTVSSSVPSPCLPFLRTHILWIPKAITAASTPVVNLAPPPPFAAYQRGTSALISPTPRQFERPHSSPLVCLESELINCHPALDLASPVVPLPAVYTGSTDNRG